VNSSSSSKTCLWLNLTKHSVKTLNRSGGKYLNRIRGTGCSQGKTLSVPNRGTTADWRRGISGTTYSNLCGEHWPSTLRNEEAGGTFPLPLLYFRGRFFAARLKSCPDTTLA
jgi:hypothetical protein